MKLLQSIYDCPCCCCCFLWCPLLAKLIPEIILGSLNFSTIFIISELYVSKNHHPDTLVFLIVKWYFIKLQTQKTTYTIRYKWWKDKLEDWDWHTHNFYRQNGLPRWISGKRICLPMWLNNKTGREYVTLKFSSPAMKHKLHSISSLQSKII